MIPQLCREPPLLSLCAQLFRAVVPVYRATHPAPRQAHAHSSVLPACLPSTSDSTCPELNSSSRPGPSQLPIHRVPAYTEQPSTHSSGLKRGGILASSLSLISKGSRCSVVHEAWPRLYTFLPNLSVCFHPHGCHHCPRHYLA